MHSELEELGPIAAASSVWRCCGVGAIGAKLRAAACVIDPSAISHANGSEMPSGLARFPPAPRQPLRSNSLHLELTRRELMRTVQQLNSSRSVHLTVVIHTARWGSLPSAEYSMLGTTPLPLTHPRCAARVPGQGSCRLPLTARSWRIVDYDPRPATTRRSTARRELPAANQERGVRLTGNGRDPVERVPAETDSLCTEVLQPAASPRIVCTVLLCLR